MESRNWVEEIGLRIMAERYMLRFWGAKFLCLNRMWWILMKNAHPKFRNITLNLNPKTLLSPLWVYIQAHLLNKIQGKMFCSQVAKGKEADCQHGCNNKESHIGLGFSWEFTIVVIMPTNKIWELYARHSIDLKLRVDFFHYCLHKKSCWKKGSIADTQSTKPSHKESYKVFSELKSLQNFLSVFVFSWDSNTFPWD